MSSLIAVMSHMGKSSSEGFVSSSNHGKFFVSANSPLPSSDDYEKIPESPSPSITSFGKRVVIDEVAKEKSKEAIAKTKAA